MREELLELLEGLRPDLDFLGETQLITGGILDSMDIVALVAEINDVFDVEIRPINLIPDNFNSIDAMLNLITELQDE